MLCLASKPLKTLAKETDKLSVTA